MRSEQSTSFAYAQRCELLRRIRRALSALNNGRISGDTFDRLVERHAAIEHATRFYGPYRKAGAA